MARFHFDFWICISYMPHHAVILNQYDSTSIKSPKNKNKNNVGTEIWGFLRQGQDFWRGLYYYISRSYGVQQINPLWPSYVIARPRFEWLYWITKCFVVWRHQSITKCNADLPSKRVPSMVISCLQSSLVDWTSLFSWFLTMYRHVK